MTVGTLFIEIKTAHPGSWTKDEVADAIGNLLGAALKDSEVVEFDITDVEVKVVK